MNIVEEGITRWERFRAGVVAELELIPEEQWGFRAAEGSRTVRALARLRENVQMLETQPIASGSSQQSRVTAMGFAASHEMDHRGQIAALVRQLGHKPALTMQIEKATAAASSASLGSPAPRENR